MTAIDSLLLDAKQAIMEEHHRRFQEHHREGEVQEAMRQFHLTVSCATELLTDSLNVLEQALDQHRTVISTIQSQTPGSPLA